MAENRQTSIVEEAEDVEEVKERVVGPTEFQNGNVGCTRCDGGRSDSSADSNSMAGLHIMLVTS
jgi:hypothetical protein